MRIPYSIYNPASGEIIQSGYCSDSVFEARVKPGQAILQGESNNREDYVDLDTLTVKARPVCTVGLQGELVVDNAISITGIPAGAKMMIQGQIDEILDYPLTDPVDDITFEEAGKYLIYINCFPMQNFKRRIYVSDS